MKIRDMNLHFKRVIPLRKGEMQIARLLIITGSVFLAGGFLIWALAKCGMGDKLGKLPGDFQFRGKNFTFYFPLATSVLLSLILSLLSYLWSKWNR